MANSLKKLVRSPSFVEFVSGILYLSIVGVVASFLLESLWLPAWESRGIAFRTVRLVGRTIGTFFPSESFLFVLPFPLGVFVGVSLVWFVDTYKRYQAIVLWAGIGIVVAQLLLMGRLFDVLIQNFSLLILSSLVIGVVAGIQIGGIPLIGWLRRDRDHLIGSPPNEFDRAPLAVWGILLLMVVAGLVDAHLSLGFGGGPVEPTRVEQLGGNLVGSAILLGAFWKFTEYESEIRTVQIGPARGGKTAILGGLYNHLETENSVTILRGGEFDTEISNRIENGEFPPRNQLREVDRGRQYRFLEIPFVSDRRFFRKKVVVGTLDYPGELITGGSNWNPLDEELEAVRQEERHDLILDHEYIENEVDVPVLAPAALKIDAALGRLSSAFSSTDQWEEAERVLENAESLSYQETVPPEALANALSRLVDGADTILFTVPLDDFAQRAAATGHMPQHTDAYWLRRSGGEYEVYSTDGELVGRYDTLDDLEFEGILEEAPDIITELPRYDHPELGDVRLVIEGRPARTPSSEYREVYEGIVDQCNTGAKSFVWVASMSDYAKRHFTAAYTAYVGNNETQNSLNPTEILSSKTLPNHPSLPHEDGVYTTFADWIETQYLDVPENWDGYRRSLRERTQEEFLYPLWYDVESNEQGERIKTGSRPILQGADRLIDRIEGRTLVRTYPWRSHLPGSESVSKSEEMVENMRESLNTERSANQVGVGTENEEVGIGTADDQVGEGR